MTLNKQVRAKDKESDFYIRVMSVEMRMKDGQKRYFGGKSAE